MAVGTEEAEGSGLTCLACGEGIAEDAPAFPDAGGTLCAKCAPTYADLLNPNAPFVEDSGEPTPMDTRQAIYDAHIAGGGSPEDSMAESFELKGTSNGQAQGSDVQGEQDTAAQGQRDPDGQAGDADTVAASQPEPGDDAANVDPGNSDLIARFDIAELARSCAAGGRLFAQVKTYGPPDLVEYDSLFTREEADIMVGFVRGNPDAPLLAMYKHLELVKRLPATIPNAEDMLALKLFHATASAALEFERERAAEAEAKAARQTTNIGMWPGDRAFKPQAPAFSPTGFSPR